MKNSQGTNVEERYLAATTNREASDSPRDRIPYPNRNTVEKSAFDNLLEMEPAFYRKVSRYLTDILARMKIPVFLIEDLVQDAWTNSVQHRDQFTEEAIKQRVCRWLIKVIHGKAVDALRHLRCCPCESLAGKRIDQIDGVEAKRVEREEWHEWLAALLEKVRPNNEENLRLLHARFFQGCSIQELAWLTGMKPCAIDGRIRRLLSKLCEIATADRESSELTDRPGPGIRGRARKR